ncbi:MAG: metallophosphoesterase family protein, partial [Clostridia bacterium]|nr:metallophosphoesterase family protein [Clostridia bacterium]
TEQMAADSSNNNIDGIVKLLFNQKIIFNNTDKNGYSSLRLLLADVSEVIVDILVTPIKEIKTPSVSFLAQFLRSGIKTLSVSKYIDIAQDYLGRVVGEESLRSIVDELVNKYVTDAFCKNLGIYGADILLDMNADPTEDGSAWIEGGDRYTRYPVRNYKHVLIVQNEDGAVAFDGHTYQSNVKLTVTPSAENGLLPNVISVSFNNDIYTEKNLTWFTAYQVDVLHKDDNGNWCYALPDSYIRYSTSENMSDAVTVKATGENVDRVLPTIDLGVIYINMNHAHKIYNRYSVKLTGLTKGTTYYYQLGKDGTWTKTFKFATASDGEFTFMAISDIQGSVEDNYIASDVYMKKALEYFGEGPAFIVSGGDNVDNGRNIMQYTWLFNDQQEIWANNTLVSAVGNHEKHDNALDSVIALPDTATVTGDTGYYYSYDYNSAHFVVLNTNDLDDENYLSTEQESWLIEDLQANQENENTTWTIVIMHKGPYTAGSHAFDNDVAQLRRQLPEIFEEYGVDLVLQGHDHTYSVSEFIGADGKKTASVSNGTIYKPEGVLYINLGTMGDKFYDYIYNEKVDLADRNGVSEKLSAYFTEDKNLELTETPVFAKITVNKDDLIIKTYTFIGDEIVPVDEIILTHSDKPALSVGAIVGIVVGSVAGAALIAVGIVFIIKKKRGKK